MDQDINEVTLVGRLGDAPIIRTTQTGKRVASLSIATTEKFINRTDVTSWHKVVAWENLADLASAMNKGQRIIVKGKLSTRSFMAKSGEKKYVTEVIATDLVNGSSHAINGAKSFDDNFDL